MIGNFIAQYKINGYNLFRGLSIIPHQDRTTGSSLESLNDVQQGYFYNFKDEEGVQWDTVAPVSLAPRIFIIKGHIIVPSAADYNATRMAISSIMYQNYVTIEMTELDIKVNARIRPGVVWRRLTNLRGQIVVEVQFQFDEIMQDIPFKDDGQEEIIYLIDHLGQYYNTQNNEYLTIQNG